MSHARSEYQDFKALAPDAYDAVFALARAAASAGIDKPLLELVKLRASQINGCAYCIDMHWKDLAAIGEKAQRLYSLDAWKECPYYTERERAALEWTESVTRITDGHAPDAVYESVRPHFSEKELSDITLAIAAINAWNRLSIAARLVPGGYTPASSRESIAGA